MAAAFQSALENPTQASVPSSPGAGLTLRTDIYNGPHGAGFAIIAALKIGDQTLCRVRQHGPETWRERAWDRMAIEAALEADYRAKLAHGVTVNEVTLAADDSDRAKFSQFATLLREAEELKPEEERTAFLLSTVKIVDIHNAVHELSVTEARALIVAYGMAAAALWVEFAQQREALTL